MTIENLYAKCKNFSVIPGSVSNLTRKDPLTRFDNMDGGADEGGLGG